ncbi:hypothetical protein HK097_010821 [Rhizophlyctis rosea]|uniref:Uncharacterized protein n=1 Tax=Rhizophlyctis rosea TaxID=64517 RepID=A0AAD5S751_9FUNG|nr:hypothetical protein HK097_010821 [Rhizophlyctis rosea]
MDYKMVRNFPSSPAPQTTSATHSNSNTPGRQKSKKDKPPNPYTNLPEDLPRPEFIKNFDQTWVPGYITDAVAPYKTENLVAHGKDIDRFVNDRNFEHVFKMDKIRSDLIFRSNAIFDRTRFLENAPGFSAPTPTPLTKDAKKRSYREIYYLVESIALEAVEYGVRATLREVGVEIARGAGSLGKNEETLEDRIARAKANIKNLKNRSTDDAENFTDNMSADGALLCHEIFFCPNKDRTDEKRCKKMHMFDKRVLCTKAVPVYRYGTWEDYKIHGRQGNGLARSLS